MKKILLVEDNNDQRILIHTVFRMSEDGYEVDEAATGTEAMQKVKSSRYDLVLLDYRLPGHTGLEVLEQMRKSGDRTPVVIMTAERSPNITVEAMRLGISDFVLKEGAFQIQLPELVKNVLEKVELELRLEKAQKESQFQSAKLASLGKILAEVLHDLRNPLSIISTSLEALRDAKDKQRALEMTLDLMLRNVERGRQIINSLLDFSRPKDYSFEKADLREVVAELIGHLKLKCDRQKIALKLDSPDRLPQITLDVQHIKGCLLNLMMNAIEAMPGGGSLDVSLSDVPEDRSLRIEVSDTGAGIKAEDQAHLFERYFTTKSNGTGLGLIITHQVIAQHRGSIKVQSDTDKGTTFTILLPLERAP